MTPSVTQVLSPFYDLSGIPKMALEIAADRGTRVHAKIARILRGEWVPQSSIQDDENPYLTSFWSWADTMLGEPAGMEQTLSCDCYGGFCGHPDFWGTLKDGSTIVIDWKTPIASSPIEAAQVAAYAHLVEHTEFIPDRIATVHLDPKGKPAKMVEFTRQRTEAWAAFASALTAFHYFKGGKE